MRVAILAQLLSLFVLSLVRSLLWVGSRWLTVSSHHWFITKIVHRIQCSGKNLWIKFPSGGRHSVSCFETTTAPQPPPRPPTQTRAWPSRQTLDPLARRRCTPTPCPQSPHHQQRRIIATRPPMAVCQQHRHRPSARPRPHAERPTFGCATAYP